MTTTALTVIDLRHGEVIDITNAETERLAQFHTDADQLKSEISDAQALVNSEILGRLDREACWTLRVGDPTGDAQFEIKAPSPTAGTETYPEADLEVALRALVERGTITEAAAGKALKRQLVLTIDVPLDADLEQLARAVIASTETQLAGVPVTVARAEPLRKAVLAGINALRKVEGTGRALDRARIVLPTGSRRAKVTVKTR